MSLIIHNSNASLPQTVESSSATGFSTIAPLDPYELGSPVPQTIFTTDASARAWNDHLKRLDPKEREFFLKYATGGVESFASLVKDLCTKHQEQSWINKINGLLRPFLRTLEMSMSIASAASQADPYPSSLVIGGIIGLLQISKDFDLYQQHMMKWLSKLSAKATLLMEFDICIYQYDEKVQEALVPIYGDILEFCQKALKLYVDEQGKRRNGIVVFGRSLIERFSDTFGRLIDNFEAHLDNYKAYALLCDSTRLMQVHGMAINSALRQYRDQEEIMGSLAIGHELQARNLQAYHTQVSALQEQRDAQRQARDDIMDSILAGRTEIQAQEDLRAAERKRAIEKEEEARREATRMLVIKWLPSVEFQHIHNDRLARVTTGTGDWFQNHGSYQSWKTTSAHTDLLWVTGKPGCGKSILAALTWVELKTLQKNRTIVARFYCDSSNPERSSYSYLLTTLLKQISSQSQKLHRDLEQMYKNEGLIQDRGPGVNEVEKLLPTILSEFAQVFIIVDGLDELREPNAFLKVLPLLLRETTCQLRVIVFCRDYLFESLPSQNTLKNYAHLNVDQGANKDDIATFISSKLSTDDPDWDADLLEVVKTVLLDRADGMFLYVSLMVGRLRGSLSQSDIIDRLKSLPRGLTKAYEANLKRILNQEEELDKTMTIKILLWIANANRSLSRKELLEALSIRCGTKIKDRGGTDRDFTTFCAELIHFDHSDFYHLVHASLRDYLLKEVCNNTSVELEDYRVLQFHAERTLAEACLTYLLFEDFSAGPVHTAEDLKQMLRDNPFLRYAAEHWGFHVALAADDAPADLVWKFIDNENARNLSMQVIMAEEDVYPFQGSSSVLHVLAYFGLSAFANTRSDLRALKDQIDGFGMLPIDYAMLNGKQAMCLWLLEKDENSILEAKPVMPRFSPIHIAVALGWKDVLDRLISNGYDVNHRASNKRWTPLASAVAQGNEWAVNRLLEAKADVNAKDAEGNSPIMIALEESHLNLVPLLLRDNTDLDAQNEDGVSALHFAVSTGNLDTVKTLLKRKPQLQVTSEEYFNRSPLHLAADYDYEEIFRELHEYGAGLDSTCLGGFRSIHLAAFHNSLKVARLLAKLKVEINPQSEDETTTLHIAAQHSGVEFVELVLEANPELNARDKDSEDTALHVAATAGATAVCKLLLDKGATVDLPNAKKHTALHLAVVEGHTETAKLLLDHRFNPMKAAVFDSPVLHYAANEGNIELLQPLLKAKADPEAANSDGHRALHFAARKGHTDFVEQLFSAVTHLDANSQDLSGKVPLHLAAAAGHLSTIRALQERSAQSNIPDSSNNLPLHYAAWNGHLKAVEMVISDAIVNSRGYYGRTALNIAAIRGHEAIARFLLDRNAILELGGDDGSTPLMNAVRCSHSEIAHLLISRNANVHTMDSGRRTLLHQAARNGDYDLVKVFIDRQCDVHAVSDFGDTLFLEAVASNNLMIVNLISNLGVNGTQDKNRLGITPVHIAAGEGDLPMLDKLLGAGAMIDPIDRIGRSALSMAAMKGRHDLVELLLRLGLNVNGEDSCSWTPLDTACEDGYVRVAELLLEHNADIHKYKKHDKQNPLHQAAAMHRPRIIRQLVDLGANRSLRDCYGYSALDYASNHPASFQAIMDESLAYIPMTLADRRTILWRNIRRELESLLSLAQPSTVESENTRLLKLGVLANSFRYLKDTEMDQTIKYLLMELSFLAESAVLSFNFHCGTCNIDLTNVDLCICRECPSLQLCNRCHENYKEGWKAPNGAPEGVRKLEQLERQVEPVRQVILPMIYQFKVPFVLYTLSFFTSVEDWADTKRKEYEDWENEFNEDGLFKFRKRPCQLLLKLLHEGTEFMEGLNEKGIKFDEESEDCGMLAKKFSDYHRTHDVIKDDDDFHCSGHQYLRISKKEYDQIVLDRRVFQSDRRLTDGWFRDLLAKCPSVEKTSETEAEPDQGLQDTSSKSEVKLQESIDTAGSNEKSGDEVHSAEVPSARSQETSDGNTLRKDRNATDNGHVATDKPAPGPIKRHPKMPRGLSSSFTSTPISHRDSAVEHQIPVLNNHAIIEDIRSPTLTATALSSLEGADDNASTGRISNTGRFTAQLLERHQNLKRRLTSPNFDSEDAFENLSLRRRATTPLSGNQESLQWTTSRGLKDAQQPIASEIPAAETSSLPFGIPSLTQEPDALPSSLEDAREASTGGLTANISPTDNFGRLVLRALAVAESIFPGFRNEFINFRLDRGDLANYSLQVEVVRASQRERSHSNIRIGG